MPHISLPLDYPQLKQTEKELKLADQLFALYVDVLETLKEWRSVRWTDVARNIGEMKEKIDSFSARCKRMPARLKEYTAFKVIK
jgi:dynein heavy chain